MRSCEITFKIKDYFPKIDSIPFEDYVCLFINGDFSEKISLIEKDFNTCKHQINNVNSDLKYKIHIVNINDSSLIGICEIVIPYAIISQIDTPGTFIKEQQLKLFIDLKTKRKLFGTLLSTGDIYLYLSAEVFVNNQNIEKKKKNFNKNRNYYKKDFNMINTYGNNSNKNNNNKKYRVITTDKDSLRNECKTYTCLKNMTNSNINSTINEYFYAPVSGERKEAYNRRQNNALGLGIKNNLTIDNNNNNKNTKNQNQKIKKVNTQRKKLTILDLMEQKIKNKKELNNKNNMNSNNISCRYNKSSSPKEIKNINLENKENYGLNIDPNLYLFSDKAKNNNIYNYGTLLKNVFSPVNNSKKILSNDKTNYIYKKKSAQKIRTKISENNIFNYNSFSPYAISNFNIYGEIEEKKRKSVKKTKSCFSTKIHMQNQNQKNNQINNLNNANNINDNIFINSLDEKQKLTDLDKNILEKGVSIRNDFQNQLNYSFSQSKYILENTYDDIYNNNNNSNRNSLNNLNDIFNIRYNRSQKEFHKTNQNFKSPKIKIDLDSSKNNTNNITPSSSNHSNTVFTQDDLKNNILNLFDFYSLLKRKINIIKENLYKNKNKLIIKKEKFNHQLKKNNRLTQKIISVESKIILHANVNCTLNEQIILPLIKIKKIESTIYQKLFGLKFYDYDIIKFREKEKNKLFEEQNIIHLLLIIIKNMIEHYDNISHVYQDDINKKKMLELILLKYEIKEKKDKININMNINNNNKNVNNNKLTNINSGKSQFYTGKIIDDEFLNKFKIIREVEEDKEYDDSEEEEKNKKEFKNENEIESFDIEENNENNINEIKNEMIIENGATKNESEKSINQSCNKYINEANEEYNKTNLINKILFEEFPKKYPNLKKFKFKNNNEYIFGDNIVNVQMINNNLEFIINKEKYNLEDFLKYFSNNNNKFININDKNKEE